MPNEELTNINIMSEVALNLIDCYTKSGDSVVKEVFMQSIDGLSMMLLVYKQSLGIGESSEESPENPLTDS